MSKLTHIFFLGAVCGVGAATAAETAPEIVEHKRLMDHGDGHLMDMDGAMIMGQNKDKLPPGCDKISGDEEITVRASHKYTKGFPGTMFGFSEHEWRVKPCTRLTVHFINEDNVRHQWMMHGLPKFLYDKGMFHLEVTGPASITGTLILPAEDRTYLVHCDIAQHMEKGMKGQLIVGKGGTPFPSIPGVTDLAIPDNYGPPAKPVAATGTAPQAQAPKAPGQATPVTLPPVAQADKGSSGPFILGIILGVVGAPWAISSFRNRFRGMSRDEILAYLGNAGKAAFDQLLGLIAQFRNKGGKH
jgi:plastocyanin